jgi:hypothetical protein
MEMRLADALLRAPFLSALKLRFAGEVFFYRKEKIQIPLCGSMVLRR